MILSNIILTLLVGSISRAEDRIENVTEVFEAETNENIKIKTEHPIGNEMELTIINEADHRIKETIENETNNQIVKKTKRAVNNEDNNQTEIEYLTEYHNGDTEHSYQNAPSFRVSDTKKLCLFFQGRFGSCNFTLYSWVGPEAVINSSTINQWKISNPYNMVIIDNYEFLTTECNYVYTAPKCHHSLFNFLEKTKLSCHIHYYAMLHYKFCYHFGDEFLNSALDNQIKEVANYDYQEILKASKEFSYMYKNYIKSASYRTNCITGTFGDNYTANNVTLIMKTLEGGSQRTCYTGEITDKMIIQIRRMGEVELKEEGYYRVDSQVFIYKGKDSQVSFSVSNASLLEIQIFEDTFSEIKLTERCIRSIPTTTTVMTTTTIRSTVRTTTPMSTASTTTIRSTIRTTTPRSTASTTPIVTTTPTTILTTTPVPRASLSGSLLTKNGSKRSIESSLHYCLLFTIMEIIVVYIK